MRTASLLAGAALVLVAGIASATSADRDRIERGVGSKMDDLQHCYDVAVARNPDLPKGRIVTHFVVETDGKVSSATIKRNDMKDAALGECVRDVFLGLELAALDRKTSYTYPLVFE
jgi:hypothetical protein